MSELKPKKKLKLENLKMETFILRFPTVTQSILQELDNQALTKCREVSLSLQTFLNQDKVLWIRMIQNYSENYGNHQQSWNLVVKQVSVDILKRLAICVESFFKEEKPTYSISPLHIAAYSGNFAICKYIFEKSRDFNSENVNEMTPLHLAARDGYLDIYKFISEVVKDKNPECTIGMDNMVFTKVTPLHLAAKNGHLDIFKFIYNDIDDKNPIGNMINHGSTILPAPIPMLTTIDVAASNNQIGVLKFILDNKNGPISKIISLLKVLAQEGIFEAFKLIFEFSDEKNPADDIGVTPFHLAAKMGRLEIYKLIFDHLDDKNPRDEEGKTPLHWAVQDFRKIFLSEDQNLIKIFKYNFENGNDVNPSDNEGNTVLHEIAKQWSKYEQLKVDNGFSGYGFGFEEKAIEIVRFIKENIGDKYPKNNAGMTPSNLVSYPEIAIAFTEK